mgnify:CR=1 FL=1
MYNFNFKLQNVLDYKVSQQNKQVSKYNNAKIILDEEEKRLIEYNKLKKRIKEKKDNLSMASRVKDLKIYNEYLNQIKDEIRKQKKQVDKAKMEAEVAKEKLITASKDKKAFEKLKEKDYEKFKDKIKKKEENQVDEIVTYINSNN